MPVVPPHPYLDGASICFKGAEVLGGSGALSECSASCRANYLTYSCACRASNCFTAVVGAYYVTLCIFCLAAFLQCPHFCQTFVAMRIYKATDHLVLFQLCLLGLAASVPNILIPLNFNLTSVSNLTLPQPLKYVCPTGTEVSRTDATLNSVLPPDPFVYRVPQSSQVITFSRYSRTLSHEDVLACLLEAALDVIKEINLGHDGLIDMEETQANSNHVHLILHPDPRLTWKMWGTTISGIRNWVNSFEFLDCDFEIKILGYPGNFGSGLLVYL